MRKPHAILGSHGRETCVATRATGAGAGLFGPRLGCIELKTLFCRKHNLAEFLGLDHLENSYFRFPSALPLRPICICGSRVTLEKRFRGVHPTSSGTPRCPSRAYSFGCAIWLVAWVRVYKRFSTVSFRILADTRKTLCNPNIRKILLSKVCNSII